jgi:molybdate transport system substrate-binding protein
VVPVLGTALFLLLAAAGPAPAAEPIRIAAASDLQAALPAVAAAFEQQTGERVAITFGSSGNFFTQIQNGAPFDLFLSADVDYPMRLARAGLVEPGSLYQYAVGRLVLWTRNDSGIDVRGGLATLAAPGVRRIAIANPEHAPYGRAAVAALRHEGVYDRVAGKLVRGENISQAAQFVESGNADVGILALSIALSPAMKSAGTYAEVPPSSYPPIEQAAAVLAGSARKKAAVQFLDFLKAPASVRVLAGYGFVRPPTAPR